MSATAARITAERLGSATFRASHGVRWAYVAGSMYKGIASAALVRRMADAGLLAYLGAGGMSPAEFERAIAQIRDGLPAGRAFGANLLAAPLRPAREDAAVDVLLAHGIDRVEAASFVRMTPALVRYRLTGARRAPDGRAAAPNRVLAKASRPEVAEQFLAPPPADIVDALRAARSITADEAALAPHVAMADDLCAEADSGGHTDGRPLVVVLPELRRLRDALRPEVHVGAAGGIGTPEAAAAAFALGADFILTGSINQCTVEAGTSDRAKGLLAVAGVQDTTVVAAGDGLETGTRAQVLARGVFFPARANRLQTLWERGEALDPATLRHLERKILRRPLSEVWTDVVDHLRHRRLDELDRCEREPARRMLHITAWYHALATRTAMAGDGDPRDYQIACGPAMGALNGLLAGTELEDWRARHPDDLAALLMLGAAEHLSDRLGALTADDSIDEEIHAR